MDNEREAVLGVYMCRDVVEDMFSAYAIMVRLGLHIRKVDVSENAFVFRQTYDDPMQMRWEPKRVMDGVYLLIQC